MTGFHFTGTVVSVLPESRFPLYRIPGFPGPEYSSVSAKIFIEFIALVIRSKIYTLLKDEMLRSDTKANYLTVPAALRELEKIEIVKSLDGNYRIDHAVTATQKAILDAFGIDVPYIKRKAALINTKLTEKPD